MRSSLALAVIAASLFLGGCHAAVGPQVGYTFDRGVSYGWEGGGGLAYLRGNVGQVIRPIESKADAEPDTTEWVSYVAAEPWIYLGATLGAAYSDEAGLGLAAGLWEGFAIPISRSGTADFQCGGDPCRPVASIAGGLRYINGEWELYVTPKVGFLQTFTLF